MFAFNVYSKKVFISTFLTLVLVCLLRLFMPFHIFLQGLILGIIISLCNGGLTWIKTKQVTAAAIGAGRKTSGIGMLTRMALAILAGFLAFRFPSQFSLAGALIGLFTVQFYAFIYGFNAFYVRK